MDGERCGRKADENGSVRRIRLTNRAVLCTMMEYLLGSTL